ncbi:MAG: ABC transporter permease [Saccharofermentans sp.]|nr:ABC transporter permease [Saccharofermentans sp.]
MKMGLYPKIAADGIRKNSRLYIPYFGVSLLMVSLFYIMHLLGFSDVGKNMTGSSSMGMILQLGTYVMAIFGMIFLFYAQSALIKGRLKEFGLYNVLGLNKRNIGRIVFYETLISWFVAVTGGIVAGVGLSKLAELGFARIIQTEINYKFNFSIGSVVTTIIVYTVIFFFIYLNALRHVRFASSIRMLNADKAGEVPPRANWFVGILGVVILLTGYAIAIRIKQPLSALIWFFFAVILIIIGTYLVLIAGSVLLCRILQKNKSYYYKTNHFVSVSSMAYRMKRNGASLASICILLTMVFVMLSSTFALYANREDTLRNHYPRELNCYARSNGFDEEHRTLPGKLEEALNDKAKELGIDTKNSFSLTNYSFSGYYENGKLDIDANPLMMNNIDFDNVVQVYFFDIKDYNKLTGSGEVLSEGQVLAGVEGNLTLGDRIAIGDVDFDIVKSINPKDSALKHAIVSAVVTTVFVVVDDLENVASLYADKSDPTGEKLLAWEWDYYFDTGVSTEKQKELTSSLITHLREEVKTNTSGKYKIYCDCREEQRNDFVKTFGGLFFLGILLSVIFLVSCVLIIYYKQISEGFEDQARFGIMQKVGMTKENIKKSINSQMLTVFLIPIIFACMHLAMVLPIVNKLLLLFGHNNIQILLAASGVCVLVCGLFYALVYKLTSNAYYKIVS